MNEYINKHEATIDRTKETKKEPTTQINKGIHKERTHE